MLVHSFAIFSSSWLPVRALRVSRSFPLPHTMRLLFPPPLSVPLFLPIVLCSPSRSLFVIVLSARLRLRTNASKRSDVPRCQFALFTTHLGRTEALLNVFPWACASMFALQSDNHVKYRAIISAACLMVFSVFNHVAKEIDAPPLLACLPRRSI